MKVTPNIVSVTGRKDREFPVAVFYLEANLGTFAASDPVLLGLFQGIRPVDRIQSVQQALRVSGYT